MEGTAREGLVESREGQLTAPRGAAEEGIHGLEREWRSGPKRAQEAPEDLVVDRSQTITEEGKEQESKVQKTEGLNPLLERGERSRRNLPTVIDGEPVPDVWAIGSDEKLGHFCQQGP